MKKNNVSIDNSFESLVQNEMQSMKSLAMQLTRNLEDANDLVQETVLKALRFKEKYTEGTNLRGWVLTILKNTFINNYRRMVKRKTFIDSTDNTYFLDLPSHRTENQAEIKFIRKDLESAISILQPELKVTFMLNIEGFKYHEIAEELNIPIGTVKTRIFVAKRILRKKLQVYGEQFGYNKITNE
ncbi:MAG: sigma-70 family RNA polymerase sigma factor [Bacteroidetes bacterium]|nr:sigma-70 family RNA polymerase sigma factor [Bacteroidota bacterium]